MGVLTAVLGLSLLFVEISGQCFPNNPCQNSAACVTIYTHPFYRCTCPPCYEGVNCQIEKKRPPVCPCLNGGDCHCYFNSVREIYRCTCPQNYYGLRCEQFGPVTGRPYTTAPTPPPTHPSICFLPKDPGFYCYWGNAGYRWYYNAALGSCKMFHFKGCGGNLNNFYYKSRCENTCLAVIPTTPAPTTPAPTIPPVNSGCFLPKETGYYCPWRAGYRWYYDFAGGTCREFYYLGCGGNANNYPTKSLCYTLCGTRCSGGQVILPCTRVCHPTCARPNRICPQYWPCRRGCGCPAHRPILHQNRCIPQGLCSLATTPPPTHTSCATNPCVSGTCIPNPGGVGFTCECACFVTGVYCQILPGFLNPINKCQSRPCQNGGSCKCIEFRYKCTCKPGYSGVNCEIGPPDPCDPNPCKNEGECVPASGGGYNCLCQCFITGINCEVMPYQLNPINPCQSYPCPAGQTCRCIGFGYKCLQGPPVPPDPCLTTGKPCALQKDVVILIDASASITTVNFVSIKTFAYELLCGLNQMGPIGPVTDIRVALIFYGQTNTVSVLLRQGLTKVQLWDQIQPYNQPAGAGTLLAEALGLVQTNVLTTANGDRNDALHADLVIVLAATMSTGGDPTIPARALEQAHPGLCIIVIGFFQQWPVPLASPVFGALPQMNGIATGRWHFVIIFKVAYTADDVAPVLKSFCRGCVNQCNPNPCNGGTCTPTANGPECTCPPMRRGPHCEFTIGQMCVGSNPCQEGGVCIPLSAATYKCNCPCWVAGDHCEDPQDTIPLFPPCWSSPCMNGGTCVCRGMGWECDCRSGYTGLICQF